MGDAEGLATETEKIRDLLANDDVSQEMIDEAITMYRLVPTRVELLESTGGDWERVEWQRALGQEAWQAPKKLLAY